ncbi:hypothetical protein CH296_01110 [Rhodococcus sp. 14-2496-1d]|uniref:hypothetical protein n=1 Tax=Rhodococcus sp. 14-2496-1d TaxID=2023146 RepID=UPI000B9BEA40|nr:hypothetical protein [Rhodococcus sp. 14-2496-1d]OZF39934.1 hypothetical protein CH296_01110 [Rhodococcus sp. 14-2496-1d]
MAADDVQITLNGQHGLIDPMAVADALSALDKIIRSFEGVEAPNLRLSDLHVSSAVMGVRADEGRVTTLHEGVEELRAGTGAIPPGWRSDSLRALIELEKVGAKAGVESVRMKIGDAVADIDRVLADNARALLEHSTKSLGAVRGVLYRYTNDSSRRSAGLREVNDQRAIALTFPARLAGDIKRLLDQEVEVWGVMHRDLEGELNKVDVEGLEAIPVVNAQIALDDVAGILGRDWTNGLGSVEWVRQQRE